MLLEAHMARGDLDALAQSKGNLHRLNFRNEWLDAVQDEIFNWLEWLGWQRSAQFNAPSAFLGHSCKAFHREEMKVRVVKNTGVYVLKVAVDQQLKKCDCVSHVWQRDNHCTIVAKFFTNISEKTFRVRHMLNNVVADNKVEVMVGNPSAYIVISSVENMRE